MGDTELRQRKSGGEGGTDTNTAGSGAEQTSDSQTKGLIIKGVAAVVIYYFLGPVAFGLYLLIILALHFTKTKKCVGAEEKPIIIYSYRKVKTGGMTAYNQVAKVWAEHCKLRVKGFKTNTYCEFPDTGPGEANEDRKDWVADIQFFNSIDVFNAHMYMTDPKGLMKTVQFLGGTDNATNFTGYGFGDWNKPVVMGIKLPRMFSMMLPPKWFEFRRNTSGFIRGTTAPVSTPPLFLFCDFHLKNTESSKAAFIKQWSVVAEQNATNPNVIGFQLTEDELDVKLLDKAKKRDPFKLVGVMIFTDFATLEECVGGLKGMDEHLESPYKVDIWAEDDNSRASEVCSDTFGGKDKHTCFTVAHGWSDHSMCT